MISFFIKSFRSYDSGNRYIFIPVEIHDVKDSKNSFKKLCRACVPSTGSNELINEMQQFHSRQKTSLNSKKSRGSSGKFTNGNSKVNQNKKNIDTQQAGTNGLSNHQFMSNNGVNNQPGKSKNQIFIHWIFLTNEKTF